MSKHLSTSSINAEDFTRDVPRGVTTRDVRQQRAPEARWMEPREILGNATIAYDPLAPKSKVLIGRLDQTLIGIEDDRHIMTVAGSRAGKSVGLVSNLLFYKGSVLATDPKGELAELTAQRRARLGQKIYVLDPFKKASPSVAGFRASYNPMSVLRPDGDTFLEDAAQIAEALVVSSPDAKDPHWDESARNFIEGVIVYVAVDAKFEGKRNLITVRKCLTRALFVPDNPAQEGAPKKRGAKPDLYEGMLRAAVKLEKDEATEAIAHALTAATLDFYGKGDTEIAGVLSTVNRQTKFLDYPAFRNVLKESSFDLGELKSDPAGVTIYLCFPATRAEISKRWMRLFVNQLLDAMEREKTKPPVPVLACLDEFPVLGYMRQLETAAGLIASFGVKLWFILQDWSQGKALYGDRWETFAGNAGILQFFGNNDLTTAEYISRRLGKTQIESMRRGEVSPDQSREGLSGRTQTNELHDLVTPDEVMRLFSRGDRLRRQLVIWAGYHPLLLQRVEYYDPTGPLSGL
ncbi:type IV secretory system conjugative DNA transfer family protein [Variovorax sp. H27-G14]|uniref:type IV secretory system conjugative DNA transfer family protein n=1 Tax=Variovorax sp. H27-G14 TaxID=3111914 RepID=UPI0038FCC26C